MREGLENLKLCRKLEDSGKFGSVKISMKTTGLIYTIATCSDLTAEIKREFSILWLGFNSGTWRQSQNWD